MGIWNYVYLENLSLDIWKLYHWIYLENLSLLNVRPSRKGAQFLKLIKKQHQKSEMSRLNFSKDNQSSEISRAAFLKHCIARMRGDFPYRFIACSG